MPIIFGSFDIRTDKMDSVSEARLSLINPQLARLVRRMAEMLELESIAIRVTQGLRSWNEQAALYAQGRTAPGSIVTKAQPGYSYHNFGLAVDIVPMAAAGPDWNVSHPVWARCAAIGKSLGLTCGAEWRTFPDYPHFQLTGTLSVSPDDTVRQTFTAGGMVEVWKEAGLYDEAG